VRVAEAAGDRDRDGAAKASAGRRVAAQQRRQVGERTETLALQSPLDPLGDVVRPVRAKRNPGRARERVKLAGAE
jgi:hypothetical protein